MADNLVEMFEHLVHGSIDEKGIYPHVMVCLRDEKSEVLALDLAAEEAAVVFWNKTVVCDEIVFGLDMATAPGQGTKYGDALIFAHWKRPLHDKKLSGKENFTIGVINYQHEPRIVDEIDWDNEFWKKMFPSLLGQFHPGMIARVEREVTA